MSTSGESDRSSRWLSITLDASVLSTFLSSEFRRPRSKEVLFADMILFGAVLMPWILQWHQALELLYV